MNEQCGNCRFYRVMQMPDKSLRKVCKLNPPTISALVIPTPKGPEWVVNGSRAEMDETDWCGKWEASKH